ncbi:hypothetical protein [Polaribacter sp.]|uniref:hypothetical protein n=1 Tax=Polaribacter sp. TaxID=1920175 RepID=UPI003F6A42E0
MKNNYKSILKYLFLAPLLMAFQCEEEIDIIKVNDYNVKITPQKRFVINETIWIEGKISAKAFNATINDSIFNESNKADTFSIYQFVEPNEYTNTKDAIDAFDLVLEIGSSSFLPSCPNSVVFVNSELDQSNLFYTYKIGLKPKRKGDFIIDFLNSKLYNNELNLSIAENYIIERFPDQIGFNQCGNTSWLYLKDTKNEFLFSVE